MNFIAWRREQNMQNKTFLLGKSLIVKQALTKKKAFTLAEVLITLTIIGVVAALTIPSLIF
jgi:prepilin-type N-terminal cleavage/methylation domain-containing protein